MITNFSSGKIVVNGKTCKDDIKIARGPVISDWWRRSGQRVDIEDPADIMEAKPDNLVIGKGLPGRMKTTASPGAHPIANNIKLFEKKSARAIQFFNQLYQEGKRVAAGIHVGCEDISQFAGGMARCGLKPDVCHNPHGCG